MLRRQSLHEPFILCFVKFLYQNWNLLQEPDGLVARSLSKIQKKLFFWVLVFSYFTALEIQRQLNLFLSISCAHTRARRQTHHFTRCVCLATCESFAGTWERPEGVKCSINVSSQWLRGKLITDLACASCSFTVTL